MAEKKEIIRTLAEFSIFFPKAPKKAEDKEALYSKFLSLVEENKELPVKVKSNKRKKRIILDSDEFMFAIYFGKTLSIRTLVNDPDKHIDTINGVGNKIINYMNIILGEGARNSTVNSAKTTYYSKRIPNLSKKIIGETRIAKINEKVEQVLNPYAISFEYKLKEKEFSFGSFSGKASVEALLSSTPYKDRIPFNFLRKEYDELIKPEELMKKLAEMEL